MPAITCIYSGQLLLIVQINLRVGQWFPIAPAKHFMMPLTADFLSAGIPVTQGMPAVLQPIPVTQEVLAQVQEFITGRLRVFLLDMGNPYDVVDAVLAAQANNPAGARQAIKQLSAWVALPEWKTILPGFARCVRITRDQQKKFTVKPEAFVEPAEKDLAAAVKRQKAIPPGDVDAFLNSVVAIIPFINTFFDKVLVMAEDQKVRENRLGLLQNISDLANGVADLSKLEGF